jgi:hypothetical protein
MAALEALSGRLACAHIGEPALSVTSQVGRFS